MCCLICSLVGGGGGEWGAWESCCVTFADLCGISGLLQAVPSGKKPTCHCRRCEDPV